VSFLSTGFLEESEYFLSFLSSSEFLIYFADDFLILSALALSFSSSFAFSPSLMILFSVALVFLAKAGGGPLADSISIPIVTPSSPVFLETGTSIFAF